MEILILIAVKTSELEISLLILGTQGTYAYTGWAKRRDVSVRPILTTRPYRISEQVFRRNSANTSENTALCKIRSE
jgi:hypothetical protein